MGGGGRGRRPAGKGRGPASWAVRTRFPEPPCPCGLLRGWPDRGPSRQQETVSRKALQETPGRSCRAGPEQAQGGAQRPQCQPRHPCLTVLGGAAAASLSTGSSLPPHHPAPLLLEASALLPATGLVRVAGSGQQVAECPPKSLGKSGGCGPGGVPSLGAAPDRPSGKEWGLSQL